MSESTPPPSATPAVRIVGLTHRYASAHRKPSGRSRHQAAPPPVEVSTTHRDAVHDLSLTIQPGEAFALLGPNGGGKTTTFRILATMLHPSGGDSAEVEVFGRSALREPAAARRELGVVFQSPSLDIKLTARENLACHAKLYGLPKGEATRRIDDALGRFDLVSRMHDRVEAFSGGMRRKLEIAKALLHRPRLLLMDEPATGLDPAARRELWDHLGALRQRDGITIAWTTHLMDEAEHADRVAILREGRLVTVQTPDQLKSGLGGHSVVVEPLHPDDAGQLCGRIDAELAPWPDGQGPVVTDGAIRFEHPDGPQVVARIAGLFAEQIRRVSVGQPTLEDAYLRLTADTGPSGNDEPAAVDSGAASKT